ncbi:MAG TPA: magnesium transporter CorA family protein [Rhizomicrobium sp.]|jgi:magnesium transporter|nr:magnesium transporter CorA family protein [Rhizomicrobium sp.]
MRHVYTEAGVPVWIDLHNPTPEEIEQARTDCGLHVPSREALDEIESSSRMQANGDTLTLSMPITPYHPNREPVSAPIGFVLSPKILVSVRFDDLHTFHKVGEKIQADANQYTSAQILTLIVEAIIDYSADRLEGIKADTRALSLSVFHRPSMPSRNVSRKSRFLRETLVKVGDLGEKLSEIRETQLALQRAIPFVADRGQAWIGDDVATRLKTALVDIQSLNDFEVHLTDKVQFLLDATLGFINNQQNDMFRVLTIASIVGIPPTFIVGLYGMNFHNMPEFNWTYGYQWGLFLIALSIIVPVGWFKWRGWW